MTILRPLNNIFPVIPGLTRNNSRRYYSRALKNPWYFTFGHIPSNFRKETSTENRSCRFWRLFQAMTSQFYLHIRYVLSRLLRFAMPETHLSPVYAALSIFEPLKRLNAICLNKASIVFMIISGSLARLALSCKWLNPKYCSTIYQVSLFYFLR